MDRIGDVTEQALLGFAELHQCLATLPHGSRRGTMGLHVELARTRTKRGDVNPCLGSSSPMASLEAAPLLERLRRTRRRGDLTGTGRPPDRSGTL
jgi:hypothetical protein